MCSGHNQCINYTDSWEHLRGTKLYLRAFLDSTNRLLIIYIRTGSILYPPYLYKQISSDLSLKQWQCVQYNNAGHEAHVRS